MSATRPNEPPSSPAIRRPLMLPALAALTLGPAALLAGAWWFQLVMGLLPCKLCLEQRWPHYAAVAIGLLALLGCALLPALATRAASRAVLGVLALVFVVSAAMGAYHSGVEWGWFAGPTDCGGAGPAAAASTMDFMKQLQTTRVVSCTQAAWTLLGLSLAGWNAVFSAALAGLAAAAFARA